MDALSGLILGRSINSATNAALYYSTNNGTDWLQAGGTITLISNSIGTTNYSSIVNTGSGTNTYINGGVTTIITNSGLTKAPIDFDNSTNLSQLDVKWAVAFWGGGNG